MSVTAFEKATVARLRGTVVTAWPEHHSGPGWANSLIWVLLRDEKGLRTEAIQEEEMTEWLRCLFTVGESASNAVTRAVSDGLHWAKMAKDKEKQEKKRRPKP